MEQVIHDARLGAVLTHFEVEGGIHVHRHGLDARAALTPKRLEEGAHRRTAAPLADPQHRTRVGIEHDAGVAMAFVQGKFVHDQAPRLRWRQCPDEGLQASAVDLAHARPMHSEHLGHVLER